MYRKLDEAEDWPSEPNFFEDSYGITKGNRYFAPYHQLLSYCFDISSRCTLSPFYLPDDYVIECPRRLRGHESLEFFVIYDVRHREIMFAQVVDKQFEMKNKRRPKPFRDNIYHLADQQMRAMFKYMLGTRPICTFWGLSFIDKSLRVYSGDNETGEVTPADVGPPSEADWNIDVLSPVGFETVKNIVKDVKMNNKAVPRPLEECSEAIRQQYAGKDLD